MILVRRQAGGGLGDVTPGAIYRFPSGGPDRLAPPVPGGTICGLYPMAWRRGELVPHHGIDWCAEKGTPIISPAGGTARDVKETTHGGRNFKIDHGGNLWTYYAHCDRILVRDGQHVFRHQIVATVGDTGVTSRGVRITPHLHFQVMTGPLEFREADDHDPIAWLEAFGIRKGARGVMYWKDGYPKPLIPWSTVLVVAGLLTAAGGGALILRHVIRRRRGR